MERREHTVHEEYVKVEVAYFWFATAIDDAPFVISEPETERFKVTFPVLRIVVVGLYEPEFWPTTIDP